MYTDLKNFGRIANRDAASLLLSPTALYGATPLQARIYDRTFLSRSIVHARPGDFSPEHFADLAFAAQTLSARIVENRGGGAAAIAELVEHYRGPAAQAMCTALETAGQHSTLYRNALNKIAGASVDSQQTLGTLGLMLFTATGCLGDQAQAIEIVERFAAQRLARGLYTTETSVGAGFDAAAERAEPDVTMSLMRVVGEVGRLPLRPLSTDPAGTVIGMLASGPHDITDVNRDVSRQHLRIWRENNHWYAQGLGSTNGTVLISGDTRETRVIEPPRAMRKPGVVYPPAEILHSDMLKLGATTTFLVWRVME